MQFKYYLESLIRVFCLNIWAFLKKQLISIRADSSENMDSENVWFDGVNKRLLEAHCPSASLEEGSDKNLMTKTTLASFASLGKKNKNEKHKKTFDKVANGKSTKLVNGHSSTNSKDLVKPNTGITDELALDCEMVECYHHKSVLARVSIVNLFGHPILDRYVAPPSRVTDYRTRYSGIRKRDLDNAPDFDTVQKEVADLIKGRIVVGHAIHNDFSVLKLSHPPEKTRDTSHYYKYLFQGKTPSLKKLCESVLNIKIQKGEHDSVIDAQATMKLYVKERNVWSEKHGKKYNHANGHRNHQKTKPKKKKTKTFYVLT